MRHVKDVPPQLSESRLGRQARRIKKYALKARQKGVRRSVGFLVKVAKSKLNHTVRQAISPESRAILLSHPIDSTGAPLVLLHIADDFAKKLPPRSIHIAAPDILPHLLQELLAKHFTVHKTAEVGHRIISAQLNIQPDDFVLMNTVAVHPNYRQYVFGLLESDKLKHAVWFIHEDKPQLRTSEIGDPKRVTRLLNTGKLSIRVPSMQTAEEYNKFFESEKVEPIRERVELDACFKQTREAAEFNQISFVISGTASDGRKGQLLFLAALAQFELRYHPTQPSLYRTYKVTFISVSDDYVSEQIKAIGNAQLGKDFEYYP
jgi:hypothetical protein